MADVLQIELRKVYALAVGTQPGLVASVTVQASTWRPFIQMVERVEKATGDDLSHLKSFELARSDDWAHHHNFLPKLTQLIAYLELAYGVADKIVEIGSLYNSLKDEELRSRCADLLSAQAHFDRVINQATLVLEDRIRRKARADKSLVGVKLVNEVIKARPSESVLVISDTPEEQEGMANICRGLMLALRNETHHHLVEGFTREEAFHICGFIDRVLKLVDGARVRAG